MTTPTPDSCLRLAEGLEVAAGHERGRHELISELKALAAHTAEQTALFLGMTDQARMLGYIPVPTTSRPIHLPKERP